MFIFGTDSYHCYW